MAPREPLPNVEELRFRCEHAAETLAAAEKSPWSRIREIGGFLVLKKVETIRRYGEELIELASEHGPRDLADLRRLFSERREALNLAEKAKQEIEARNAARDAKQLELGDKAREVSYRARELGRKVAEIRTEQRRKWDAEVKTLTIARERLQSERSKLTEALKKTDEIRGAVLLEVARAEKAVEVAAARRVGIPAPDALGDTSFVEKRLDEITLEHRVLDKAATTRGELQALVGAIEKLSAEAEVFKAVEWGLQRLREHEVNTAGGPLREILTRFLAAAHRKEIPYLTAGQGICEIGWTRPDGQRVSVQALSGGEYALFAAGLTAAVTIARGAKVRILMVEAGEADERTLGQLLRGIESIQEFLSTAIVFTHLPTGDMPGSNYLSAPWSVHRLHVEPLPQEKRKMNPTAETERMKAAS